MYIFAFIGAATRFLFTASLAAPVPMQISLKTSQFFTRIQALFFKVKAERFTITNMLMKSANPQTDVIVWNFMGKRLIFLFK